MASIVDMFRRGYEGRMDPLIRLHRSEVVKSSSDQSIRSDRPNRSFIEICGMYLETLKRIKRIDLIDRSCSFHPSRVCFCDKALKETNHTLSRHSYYSSALLPPFSA